MDTTTGSRIKTAREEAGFTQKDVAAHFDVDKSTVHRWEHGDGGPLSLGRLNQLAELFGVRAAWLAYGEEPKTDADSSKLAAGAGH